MNQKKPNSNDERMCIDSDPPSDGLTTSQPDEQQQRTIPQPVYDYPSWTDLYLDYLNPFSTPTPAVDYWDTGLQFGKASSAVVGGSAVVAAGGLAAAGAAAAGGSGAVIAGSIGPGAAGTSIAASIAGFFFLSD